MLVAAADFGSASDAGARRRILRTLALGLLLACSEPTSTEAEARPEAPATKSRSTNVFLISLDSASARYLEPWGAPAGSSPNVQRLAQESVVFEAAYSQSATTVSSVASLLTGVRGTTHLVEPKTMEPLALATLPERLREHGYQSFGFIANPMAGLPRLGFHRGFEHYQQVYAGRLTENPKYGGTPYRLVYPEDLNARVTELIGLLRPTHTFAYLHYLQPHLPYDPPERYLAAFAPESAPGGPPWSELREQWLAGNETGEASPESVTLLEARYRANLLYADAGLGELIDALREAGLYDDALIVLTADHGEAFFGHGRFGHNWTLYDDMTHIPLLMRFPASDRITPRRIASPTETIDLVPTLLDYLGLPPAPEAEGDSLWPLIQGRADGLERPEVVLSTAWRDLHAIRAGPYKLIVDSEGRQELYDLRSDPEERHDLAEGEAETAAALHRQLTRIVDLRSGEAVARAPHVQLDPEVQELLETLGYGDATPEEGD